MKTTHHHYSLLLCISVCKAELHTPSKFSTLLSFRMLGCEGPAWPKHYGVHQLGVWVAKGREGPRHGPGAFRGEPRGSRLWRTKMVLCVSSRTFPSPSPFPSETKISHRGRREEENHRVASGRLDCSHPLVGHQIMNGDKVSHDNGDKMRGWIDYQFE